MKAWKHWVTVAVISAVFGILVTGREVRATQEILLINFFTFFVPVGIGYFAGLVEGRHDRRSTRDQEE